MQPVSGEGGGGGRGGGGGGGGGGPLGASPGPYSGIFFKHKYEFCGKTDQSSSPVR